MTRKSLGGSFFCPKCMTPSSHKDLNRCAQCGHQGHGFYSSVERFEWIPVDFGQYFDLTDLWVTERLEKLEFKTNQGQAIIYRDPRDNSFHGALNQKNVETQSFSMCLLNLLSRAQHK